MDSDIAPLAPASHMVSDTAEEKQLFASIVICAYNDADTIGPVVAGVVGLSYPHKEILVINDYSTDSTAVVVSAFPQVQLINNQRNLGLGGSMNVGLAQSRGEIVVYVQSDCAISDPDWLDKMLAPFSDLRVGAVVSQRRLGQWHELPLGSRLFETVAPQALRNRWGELRDIEFFRGKADAYRRDVLEKLGGFDSATFFTSGEDTDLSIKMRQAGYRIVLSPDADLDYLFSSRQKSIGGGLRKALLYGRSAALLFRRHGYDGLRTRHFLLALASFVLTPWWLVFPESSWWAYLPLFIASLGVGLRARPFAFRVPLAAFCLLLLSALTLWRGFFWPGDLGASLIAVYAAFTLAMAWQSPSYAWKQGAGLGFFPGAFLYAVVWRLLSGVGYLQGWLQIIAEGLEPAEWGVSGWRSNRAATRPEPTHLPVSVCIITKDEEEKLPACLGSVQNWADDIMVVDSFSTDNTVDIAENFGARVLLRRFTDFSDQKNYAVAQARNDWVLVLDADERATPELWEAVAQHYQEGDFQRYAAFCFPRWTIHEDGRFHLWVAHYPSFVSRLFDRRYCAHVGLVHEGLDVRGRTGFVRHHIIHEPHRGLARLEAKGDLYRRLEQEKETGPGAAKRRGLSRVLNNAWFYLKAMFVDLGFWRRGPRYWIFMLQWFAYRYIPMVRPLASKEKWSLGYLRRQQGGAS